MAIKTTRRSDVWSVAEAKAKFSEVIERAKMEGPQRVTKNGRDAVVVVSAAEWDRRDTSRRSLLDVLQKAQLEDGELVIERHPEPLREGSLAEFFANSSLRGLGSTWSVTGAPSGTSSCDVPARYERRD
jgi:prevent-host-death family protein